MKFLKWPLREDGIEIDVSIRVDMKALEGMQPKQIAAFLNGIGLVIAAAQRFNAAPPAPPDEETRS